MIYIHEEENDEIRGDEGEKKVYLISFIMIIITLDNDLYNKPRHLHFINC